MTATDTCVCGHDRLTHFRGTGSCLHSTDSEVWACPCGEFQTSSPPIIQQMPDWVMEGPFEPHVPCEVMETRPCIDIDEQGERLTYREFTCTSVCTRYPNHTITEGDPV